MALDPAIEGRTLAAHRQHLADQGENINRGFWLGLPWHGQGLMAEACEAVTDFWFNTLGFPVLRAPKAVANIASRRISEKSGMRLVATEEHDYVSGRLPAEIWKITTEEWNARHNVSFEQHKSRL